MIRKVLIANRGVHRNGCAAACDVARPSLALPSQDKERT